jgi:hypothetical protein
MTEIREGVLLRVAAEIMIQNHGPDADRVARELAASADRVGDLLSADAWRDLVHAINALQTA